MAVATPPPPSPPAPRGPSIDERGVARHDSIDADRWSSFGSVKVLRSADVREARLHGSTTLGASLLADRLTVDGTLEVGGDLVAREVLSARGELRVAGTVRAGEASVRGPARVVGAVTVERKLEVVGELRAPSVAAGELRVEGSMEVPGAIRSTAVNLALHHGSRVGSIEARSVRLSIAGTSPIDRLRGQRAEARVERVEAERVEIDGVDVGFVHADVATLGPGAHVTTLEAKEIRRHPTSRVGPESRSPPPYGLRR